MAFIAIAAFLHPTFEQFGNVLKFLEIQNIIDDQITVDQCPLLAALWEKTKIQATMNTKRAAEAE